MNNNASQCFAGQLTLHSDNKSTDDSGLICKQLQHDANPFGEIGYGACQEDVVVKLDSMPPATEMKPACSALITDVTALP